MISFRSHLAPRALPLPRKIEQAPHNTPGAQRLLQHHLHIGAMRRIGGRLIQDQLRKARNSGQWIVEFMGDTRSHFADRDELGGLNKPALRLLLGQQARLRTRPAPTATC